MNSTSYAKRRRAVHQQRAHPSPPQHRLSHERRLRLIETCLDQSLQLSWSHLTAHIGSCPGPLILSSSNSIYSAGGPAGSAVEGGLTGGAAALDRLAGETQFEALEQPRDAVGVHLELVAGTEVGQCLRIGLGDAAELD
jgi:hypothetical protein